MSPTSGDWRTVSNEAAIVSLNVDTRAMPTHAPSKTRTATPTTRRRAKAAVSRFKTRMYKRAVATAARNAWTRTIAGRQRRDDPRRRSVVPQRCERHAHGDRRDRADRRPGIASQRVVPANEDPVVALFRILAIPKATAERKAATGAMVVGRGGQAAIALVKLLGIAQGIVGNSTASRARGFDTAAWLGSWIERPQPALGGRKPADVVDTPTGVDVVARLLGSVESGAYQ